MNGYQRRAVDDTLADAMAAFPAVMVVGPRACGKTTSAIRIAGSVVRLDEPADANRYRLAVDESLRKAGPLDTKHQGASRRWLVRAGEDSLRACKPTTSTCTRPSYYDHRNGRHDARNQGRSATSDRRLPR